MEKTYEVEVELDAGAHVEDSKVLAVGAAQIQTLAAADGHSLTDQEVLQGLHVERVTDSNKCRVSKTIQF
ncbi:MAG: hypothetical protein AVDCRST_MAG83-1325 [uncultured Arthrobacter sp.]|uniref:Uncharacterized protein n=1 Tax=uncultured Arthrobacter sp. TaxID=114050 RepID=A0A6J4HVY3_9MICC|nr:hypothetical protein [uncultured Arthrobacter sp.]CAA9235216.1 MAG: hypothetical protein AVDCRST_MAG83-1325 [uncultured Arthrobacter sp.]